MIKQFGSGAGSLLVTEKPLTLLLPCFMYSVHVSVYINALPPRGQLKMFCLPKVVLRALSYCVLLTTAKVIRTANQKKGKYPEEPMKIQSEIKQIS